MLRTLPRAVLVDLDDTILDDSGSVRDCWREACAASAPALGDLPPDILFATIERVGRAYWSDPERHLVERCKVGLKMAQLRTACDPIPATGSRST